MNCREDGDRSVALREKNIVTEGQVITACYGETANSCALDRCLEKAKEMMHWDENSGKRSRQWESPPSRCCDGDAGILNLQRGQCFSWQSNQR